MNRLLILVFLTAVAMAQTIDDVVLPKKTEIFITLERAISSRTATAGDKFFGRVAVPVTQNDKIVIPAGSYIIGHVDTTKEAGRIRGKAELGLRFDTVILPDGVTREIQAVLASAEGYETGTSEEGKVQAEKGQGPDIAKGAGAGASVGATVGSISGRSLSSAGFGAGIGAATGAIIGALMKNKEVDLPKGTSITVRLDNDTRFIKPPAPKPGEPL